MQVISIDEVFGSGITFITSDISALYDQPEMTQESLNEMCDQLIEILEKHNYRLELVLENETAMRVQGRVMLNEYFKMLDQSYIEKIQK
jgi:hypothetical protein